MEVEGLGRGKDFKLWPGGGRAWDWSEYGTDHGLGIQEGEVQDLILNNCSSVILTTGRFKRLKVPVDTIESLKRQGIAVVVVDTKKGIKLYNEYTRKGLMVGGLFHTTC